MSAEEYALFFFGDSLLRATWIDWHRSLARTHGNSCVAISFSELDLAARTCAIAEIFTREQQTMNLKLTVTRRFGQFVLAIALCFLASAAMAQLPLFNGAEGFGGTFTGSAPAAGWFSNATVYHVTNLNDSGAGSLARRLRRKHAPTRSLCLTWEARSRLRAAASTSRILQTIISRARRLRARSSSTAIRVRSRIAPARPIATSFCVT